MSTHTQRIAELNDLCRRAPGIACRLVITAGIAALPKADQWMILHKVTHFEAFTSDNNPYGERDFGSFDHNDHRILWKIDYYDTDMVHGSEDPADPAKTVRVLTILLPLEW